MLPVWLLACVVCFVIVGMVGLYVVGGSKPYSFIHSSFDQSARAVCSRQRGQRALISQNCLNLNLNLQNAYES